MPSWAAPTAFSPAASTDRRRPADARRAASPGTQSRRHRQSGASHGDRGRQYRPIPSFDDGKLPAPCHRRLARRADHVGHRAGGDRALPDALRGENSSSCSRRAARISSGCGEAYAGALASTPRLRPFLPICRRGSRRRISSSPAPAPRPSPSSRSSDVRRCLCRCRMRSTRIRPPMPHFSKRRAALKPCAQSVFSPQWLATALCDAHRCAGAACRARRSGKAASASPTPPIGSPIWSSTWREEALRNGAR